MADFTLYACAKLFFFFHFFHWLVKSKQWAKNQFLFIFISIDKKFRKISHRKWSECKKKATSAFVRVYWNAHFKLVNQKSHSGKFRAKSMKIKYVNVFRGCTAVHIQLSILNLVTSDGKKHVLEVLVIVGTIFIAFSN